MWRQRYRSKIKTLRNLGAIRGWVASTKLRPLYSWECTGGYVSHGDGMDDTENLAPLELESRALLGVKIRYTDCVMQVFSRMRLLTKFMHTLLTFHLTTTGISISMFLSKTPYFA
jgi:hypothetical protein